ncbi:MAG: hypothetical protein Q8O46_01230 [bacterium]|nr:hypothetical protein [bacterium]
MESDQITKAKGIETYADDMVGAIQAGEEGLVKKIIQEQAQQENIKRSMSSQSAKNKLFMFVGALLLVVAVLALVGLFMFKKITPSVEVTQQPSPIIFTDKTEFIEVAGEDRREIANSVRALTDATEIGAGKIRDISLTENQKVIGLERFLTLTEGSFPIARTDLISNFFIGVLGKNTGVGGEVGGELFFLLKVLSLNDVFVTMRFWEKKMFADLYEFFSIDITPETSYLLTKDFEDGIVENKNARILYNNNHNLVFAYVFLDNKSIVLASTAAPVREVILRLSSGELRK